MPFRVIPALLLAVTATGALAQSPIVVPPQGLSADYGACLKRARGNTVQLGLCEQGEMASQDARLNKAYQQVMRQMANDPSRQAALRTRQRAWLKERDYTCKVDRQTVNSSCIVSKTAARADELERMIRF